MMDAAQAAPFIQSMTYEAGLLEYEDFPRTEKPVNILGTTYSALHELDDIRHDMKSRLWYTYRWGFAPIGGEGPTSDQGWGCMLRCGQMMLAQTLINLHLGREWRWYEGKNDLKYYDILKMFLDKKTSCYSIHQIANMGASEGKNIGEWFGPNTIAQVLKKLAVYDDWSKLAIHIALDNTLIIEDIKSICKCSCLDCDRDPKEPTTLVNRKSPRITNSASSSSSNSLNSSTSSQSGRPTIFERVKAEQLGVKNLVDVKAESPSVLSYSEQQPVCTCGKSSISGVGKGDKDTGCTLGECSTSDNTRFNIGHWKPVLIIIPLRLGLSEINPVYVNALKNCLALRQSVGIIGGKPNQAHWFVGTVGNELIYLDPHTRQPIENMRNGRISDESYHCPYACRMAVTDLDPSIAVGFFCATEDDFVDFTMSIQKFIIGQEKTPMFEMHGKRPKHWPPFDPAPPFSEVAASSSEFECVDRQYDTDEEFELL